MSAERSSIAALFGSQRVVPVIEVHDVAATIHAVQALVDGGLAIVEIVMRTPVALDAIEAVRREVPAAVVGAGTVRTAAHWHAAVDAGAQFIVSPGTTTDLYRTAARSPIPFLPGIATVSEALEALRRGHSTVKLYPAALLGGIAMIDAMASVMGGAVSFVPTGGLAADDVGRYLALAAVLAVGGSFACPAKLVETQDWAAISARARQFARWSL
ncbi:MAG: bifunctional 4-hydroxy-2-oxoglutarate aldolase/2-dehydro-3-deoxy-phosphogluconate aldolase [Ilumatobacteraceae bacterium]